MAAAAAAARPLVTIQTIEDGMETDSVPLPLVMNALIRPDVVAFVHANILKNPRLVYAVCKKNSAESWDIVCAGQGAFGNTWRGGRIYAPTKNIRRWHVKIPAYQKKFAVASAIAATTVPALARARGLIKSVPALPCVVSDSAEGIEKTSSAIKALKAIGALPDPEKMRHRRYISRKGPLIVYSTEGSKMAKAFRSIPGVEVAHVSRLNLQKLAPGGRVGRFVIWTKSAFQKLDEIYGTFEQKKKPIKKESTRPPLKKNPVKTFNKLTKLLYLDPTTWRMFIDVEVKRLEAVEVKRLEAKQEKLSKKRSPLSKEEAKAVKAAGELYETVISDSSCTDEETIHKVVGCQD